MIEWISVSKRKPDLELVGVKQSDRSYFPCLTVVKSTALNGKRYVRKLWYGEDGFTDQDMCPMNDVVTHWAYLPELPAEDWEEDD
jgi:hypothetical protein